MKVYYAHGWPWNVRPTGNSNDPGYRMYSSRVAQLFSERSACGRRNFFSVLRWLGLVGLGVIVKILVRIRVKTVLGFGGRDMRTIQFGTFGVTTV